MRCTAGASRALAPRPYTVSVGNATRPPPSKIAAACWIASVSGVFGSTRMTTVAVWELVISHYEEQINSATENKSASSGSHPNLGVLCGSILCTLLEQGLFRLQHILIQAPGR